MKMQLANFCRSTQLIASIHQVQLAATWQWVSSSAAPASAYLNGIFFYFFFIEINQKSKATTQTMQTTAKRKIHARLKIY